MCVTGDGVNTDVIGLRALPLSAEGHERTPGLEQMPQYLCAAGNLHVE